jgi:radical SAM superfamily enzyme YgiQ (UPF0313 family)
MTWKLKQNLRSLLSQEQGTIIKDWGGKASVALIYPNTYEVGMGNLAVHSLYHLLNRRDDIVCERAFWPGPKGTDSYRRSQTPIMSLESQRPLSEFDMVAFSISFENDYLNILPLLELARIPYLPEQRPPNSPLLLAGGAAPTLNPKALSGIFDAITVGEAEGFEPDLFDLLASRLPKEKLIDELGKLPGIYVPSHRPGPGETGRPPGRHVRDLDPWPTQTVIYSQKAQFGDMHLIEVQRGCPRGCKFCATPIIYPPPRHRSAQAVLAMVDGGLKQRRRFGLIGADLLSYPHFARVAQEILRRKATFSTSSARADAVDDEKADLLAKAGLKSMALGVEAGNERLRGDISKPIPDETFVEAAGILASHGITALKLYFMIGLPNETDQDIKSIVSLSKRVRDALRKRAPRQARTTAVVLTVAPFVPKLGTPFENAQFAGEARLKEIRRTLTRLMGREKGISMKFDPPFHAAVEAYLSKADIGALEFLEQAHRLKNPRQALAGLTP